MTSRIADTIRNTLNVLDKKLEFALKVRISNYDTSYWDGKIEAYTEAIRLLRSKENVR